MDVACKRLIPLPAAHLTVAQEEVGAVSGPREVRSFHDGKRCGAVFPGQVMVEEVTGHERDVASSFGGIVVVSVVMVTGNDHRMSGVHHQGVVSDLPIAGQRLYRCICFNRYANRLALPVCEFPHSVQPAVIAVGIFQHSDAGADSC
ncbi:MAG: hypothetical protein ACYST5_21455 [Planctomycetota bacterium]